MIRKLMLEKFGAEVLLAYDSRSCLDIVSESDVDLVLLDYHLGEASLDGEQVAHVLRTIRPSLPLIMLTGDCMLPPSARHSVDQLFIKGQGKVAELLDAIQRLVPNALPLRPQA